MTFFEGIRGLSDEASRNLSDSNQTDSGWPFLFRAFFGTFSPVDSG
jgi:hypothetical protein